MKALNEEWQAWVRENIQRGCSRAELLGILVREGFDQEAARAALALPPSALPIPNLRRVESTLPIELFIAEDFLSRAECAQIIEIMQAHLRTSTITVENEPDQYFRRSKTCDLSFIDHPAVRRLDSRICSALRIEPALAEPTQGQYYDVDDEFKAHTDYFEPYELERFSTPTWGQRTWTFMIYLNEPDGGGETAFTALGLSIRPRIGRAVIWNSLHPDGQPNPNTLHHGTPVKSGYKAIVTKWFRMPRSAS